MASSSGSATSYATISAAISADAWAATRAQTAIATQLVGDSDDYLAEEKREIGRQISATEHELFVSCDPAEALQQQFEHLRPEYIAVHDIATASSKKLLAGVAAAIGRPVQKLAIRRQGYGTTLATIDFVALATAGGGVLRMYSADSDADGASRRALARMLLGYSRLGVVMVGDLPAHGVAGALKPLNDDILAGPWLNRQMLLLPLGSANHIVGEGAALSRGTGVQIRVTPQVGRPADAWNFIHSSWARLRETADRSVVPALAAFSEAGTRAAAEAPAAARAADALRAQAPAMRPMPTVPTAAGRAQANAGDLLSRYVQRLSELPGMVSCCVFDVAAQRGLAHAGARPGPAELTSHGAALLGAIANTSRTLGFGHALPEAAITLGSHHLLLRAVPRHAGLALHAVLDKTANPTLARLQVLRLDSLFESGA